MQSALFENILLNSSHSSLPRAKIPSFLYGCAWKKERTSELVFQALSAGFRGIDVAAQPKHYREDLAGAGIRRAISEGKVRREDLFIQTKFTSVDGQDHSNMPYDPSLPIAAQVEASLASSLHNLRHSSTAPDAYLDSLVLHSPLRTLEATLVAWTTLEAHVPARIRALGISNTSLPVLAALYDAATVKPAVVQNRFYADSQYDRELRAFCRARGIVYQSFWTLTANPPLLKRPPVVAVAKAAGVAEPVAFYALVMGLEGTVVCNGTKSHMVEDLEGLEKVQAWAKGNDFEWRNQVKGFRDVIGDNDDPGLPKFEAMAQQPR